MKHLIAEKKFISDLISSPKCETMLDFIEFLKNDFFGYDLICDFSNVDEYQSASIDNPLWELLLDKYNNIKFVPTLSNEIKDDSFYTTIGEQNIFLTDHSLQVCDDLRLERGYIYMNVSNLSVHWENFKNFHTAGVHFKITNSTLIPNNQKLDCWTKLNNFLSPLTSLIFFDKYILEDKANQKMTDNLFPILDLVCRNSDRLKKPLNITIITELKSRSNIEDYHSKINSYLHENNYSNVQLNIIKHNKAYYPANFEGLHSRFILTNYFHFKCDGSFNFFKQNGKINVDTDLRIDFSLSKKHRHFYKKELNDISEYVRRLTNNPSHPNFDMKFMYYNNSQNYLFN